MEKRKHNILSIVLLTAALILLAVSCKKQEQLATSPINPIQSKKNVRIIRLVLNFTESVIDTGTALWLIRVEIIQNNMIVRRSENIRYRSSYNFGDPRYRNHLLLTKPLTFENIDALPKDDTTLIIRSFYTNTSRNTTDTFYRFVGPSELKSTGYGGLNDAINVMTERY